MTKDYLHIIEFHRNWVFLSLIIFAFFLFFLSKKLLNPYTLKRLQEHSNKWSSSIGRSKILYVAPHIIVSLFGFFLSKGFRETYYVGYLTNTAFLIYLSFSLTLLVHRVVVLLENLISSNDNITSPSIRSYSQFLSLIVFLVGVILTACLVLGISPTVFLGSIGAIAAFLTLVFKDTLQSFVACVQITFNRLLLKGDFIKIGEYNLEGNIADISLNFVKIKKTDGTIFVMPTYKILETPFENFRNLSMEKSRRIKKAFFIDQDSILFMNDSLMEKYQRNPLIAEQIKDIRSHKTNSSLFREYLEKSLIKDPLIRDDKTILVRFLNPTSEGIPLEVYAFTKDFDWASHEKIKSQILEMILASLKEFDLKVHQIS